MKRDRHWQMKQLFLQKRSISIQELCNAFGISVETARRDLNTLEQDGIVRRIYGGAVLVDNTGNLDVMPPWDDRFTQNLKEKRAIAREILRWIPDNSIIALDSGTSTYETAKLLREKKNLTILCNDLRIAAELSANTDHTIYCIGGAVKKDDMITTGFLATDFLEYFSHIDLTILSADGFNVSVGLSDHNVEMGTLKTAMIKKSSRVLAGIDHSKFSINAFYKVCDIKSLSMVITDEHAPQHSIDTLNKAGIQTVIVKA